jgi:hypothetical protein
MDELPDELVLEVLEYLYHTDARHLWSISLANRRLHRIAKDLIYRTFSLDCGDPALFIRALASSPRLENCVQDVDWDCRRKNNYTLVTSDAFQFSGEFTQAERQHIEERVGYGSSLGMTGLNQRFNFLGEESYLRMFLLFTPKVKTIRITIPTKWDRHAIWFKSALNSQKFSNLQEAHIIGPMRIQNVYALFLVPSLLALRLDNVYVDRNLVQRGKTHEWKTNSGVFERLQREGSGLQHLRVQGAWSATVEIERLLKLFRSLQTLELEFDDQGFPTDTDDLRSLLTSVAHQYDSLTSLSLGLGCAVQHLSVLELLKDFKHLRILKLGIIEFDEQPINPGDLRTYLGHLPSHLEELVMKITNIDGNEEHIPPATFFDALQAIAPATNTILPGLKKLTISDWDPLIGTFTCQTKLKALQLGFATAGIELSSRPRAAPLLMGPPDDRYYNDPDLYALDYIEEDWVWVQWIWNGDWVRDWNGDPVDDGKVCCLVSDEEEDWVMVHRVDSMRLREYYAFFQREEATYSIPGYPTWYPEGAL